MPTPAATPKRLVLYAASAISRALGIKGHCQFELVG